MSTLSIDECIVCQGSQTPSVYGNGRYRKRCAIRAGAEAMVSENGSRSWYEKIETLYGRKDAVTINICCDCLQCKEIYLALYPLWIRGICANSRFFFYCISRFSKEQKTVFAINKKRVFQLNHKCRLKRR